MESSDNNATSSPTPATNATRRSGRVVKAPEKFAPSAPAAAKRKRATDHDEEDVENESPDGDEQAGDGEEEADDDTVEEEPGKSRRKKSSSQTARSKKPAAKKPKINGEVAVAGEHAASLPSRPKKNVRIEIARRDVDGLYADVFASGDSSDDVAGRWYHKYQEDNAAAVTDLVNFILLAAGCDQHVTEDDIRDPDNCQNRLADLQSVFTEEGITDYPLISKVKTSKPFRDLLVNFFKSLVNVMHETEVLYRDTALMENIARWVASMSSSTLRPFRHTATTVVLAMQVALVDVAKKLDDRITKMTQQTEAERSRKGRNKEKLSAIQRNLEEANQSREICQEQIKDFFDTVFVHRYRDIDPKIRTECVEAVGTWIWQLPTVFNDPQYLRYLGWMLSDVVPQTRHEVLRQLARIFKRDSEKLGHFIDRFKPRLVEMAAKDSDVSVRVAAVSVIETLRATGMLDPAEIDAIGKLVFDSETRVRKAAVDFFAHCLQDQIDGKIEDIGGETVDELFGEDEEGDFYSPRRDWISIKCLAETLAAYDAQLEEEQGDQLPRGLNIEEDMVNAVAPESRITLASQALYEKMDLVRNWEVLSGYLLYDHSARAKGSTRSRATSNEATLRNAVAPEGQEELILLEVLASAVKQTLSQIGEAEKSRKRHARSEVAEAQEETAIHLAITIPKLLKKFGAEPSTATTVLRLEHFLDLDIFQQLRQDATTYAKLMDEICIQFDRHVDKNVLNEATGALLHARQYDELQEMTDARISTLWENIIKLLRNFDRESELAIRGNLEEHNITQLGQTLAKIGKLASVSDSVEVLEAEGTTDDSTAPPIEILARIVYRGKLESVDEELDDLEDEAVSFAIRACQFYFMWKVRALIKAMETQTNISNDEIDRLSTLRKTYQMNLINTLTSRGINDELRLFATGALCDLHVLLANLRQPFSQAPETHEKYRGLLVLMEQIPAGLVPELIEIFDAAERAYAKRARKTLNEPAEDEDPIDDDQFSDDENEDQLTEAELKTREVRAERALCELSAKLVLAILAKMVDQVGPQAGKLQKRMLRNQNKLGNNFREVVAYLDEEKLKEGMRTRGKAQKGKGKPPASRKPVAGEEIVVADDESEEDPFEEVEPEEGTVEDLRRRELLDDPIEEPDEDDRDDGAAGDRMDEDDDVLGD